MSDVEMKRQALCEAFGKTDSLINQFLHVLREEPFHGFEVPQEDRLAFESAAQRIIPDVNAQAAGPGSDPAASSGSDPRSTMDFARLQKECVSCTRCRLCDTRHNTVFGEGCSDRPMVMVIGEGPGETEDLTGRPFVGKAGQFLDKWLASISLSRQTNCYITNIVKCRPPENRDPAIDEKEICKPFLKQQIALIKPQAILCLGKPSSLELTGLENMSMSQMHGRFFFHDSIPLMCTYHPAAVLRDVSLKRPVWDDLQKLARFLGLEIMSGRKK